MVDMEQSRLDGNECSNFKVIITGFGPFKSHVENVSWEAVSRLPNKIEGANIDIIKEQIEVSYNYVDERIPQLWFHHKPDLVIHVGVSEKARAITLESCGHRDAYKKPDVRKEFPASFRCQAAESCTYDYPIERLQCDLDLTRLMSEFQNKSTLKAALNVDVDRVDLIRSCDAGRYLCEYIYFTSLSIDNARCLFIHVPCMDKPYCLQELTDSLLSIIYILAQTALKKR